MKCRFFALCANAIGYAFVPPFPVAAAAKPPEIIESFSENTGDPNPFVSPMTLEGALHDAAVSEEYDRQKPEGDYGDVSYADPGYRNDRKPRYPIDTERHIRAAWSYINREHNKSMYTASQVAQIKARIVSAWKNKIDPDGPPSAR